ncbi:subunit of U2 snRNP spliceosome [Ordospora colligata]|uniref:Subunit of U2 snRNP spliceosome n=1 Tax=Ordospora colligata OC4 TaxID=1354746 RepID=A0A0B2UCU5_9MICR|nr:subunit of U2 snRNP spliceosome [Ordospora colligata OC4]KHN68856.1 subunit of U2 snRNP spliceosome [Ordospora colligata OC4]TBU13890.1 subunit of U2 snRNP spliceosome [Ordospora colligata]TBU14079.1 subunit of U2 snRNP spliceosome [Ordospora colligata]TBU17748.1 subunit of U2 snRNP spliceosome [Ordospora colligata]
MLDHGDGNDEHTDKRNKMKIEMAEWEEKDDLSTRRVSKWEITPRTATQSKRLKWDQTPLGYIKMEEDVWSGEVSRMSARWDTDNARAVSAVYSEMSTREINMCLPSKGYKRYDVADAGRDVYDGIEMAGLPEIPVEEKDFFMPIFSLGSESEVNVYKGILLMKNGNKAMCARGLAILKNVDTEIALEAVILMGMSLELDDGDKMKLVEMLKALLEGLDMYKVKCLREILFVLGSYCWINLPRKLLMSTLMMIYANGIEFVISRIESDFSSKDFHIREVVGKVIGTFARCFEMNEVLELLNNMGSSQNVYVRKCCVRAVLGICDMLGNEVSLYLGILLDVLCMLIQDGNRFVKMDAANAMSYVFSVLGLQISSSDRIFHLLRDEFVNSRNIESEALLKAMSHLCHNNVERSRVVFDFLRASGAIDTGCARIFDKVCLMIDKEDAFEYFCKLLSVMFDRGTKEYENAISAMCVKMCVDSRVTKMILAYYSDPWNVRLVSKIFSNVENLEFDVDDADKYYRCICSAIRQDTVSVKHAHLLTCKRFIEKRHTEMLVSEFIAMLKDPVIDTRIRGLCVLRKIAGILSKAELVLCGNLLMENITDENQDVLSNVLRTICVVYNCHRFRHASDVILGILPVIRTKEQGVTESAVELLYAICVNAPDECAMVSSKEWLRISYELIDVLSSWSRRMRRNVIGCLGCISRIVGPQDILNILMDGLESENRCQRIGASIAIAIVGEYNGFHSVLPTLLADYRIPSVFVQQGIIKAMECFMQRVPDVPWEYIYSMVAVIEDALMDKDPAYRSAGIILVKHVVLNHRKVNTDVVFVTHLLNMVWINILDSTPIVKASFDECMEAFSVVLTSRLLYTYVLGGLLHPSGIVRQRYYEVLAILEHFDSTSLSQSYLLENDFFMRM